MGSLSPRTGWWNDLWGINRQLLPVIRYLVNFCFFVHCNSRLNRVLDRSVYPCSWQALNAWEKQMSANVADMLDLTLDWLTMVLAASLVSKFTQVYEWGNASLTPQYWYLDYDFSWRICQCYFGKENLYTKRNNAKPAPAGWKKALKGLALGRWSCRVILRLSCSSFFDRHFSGFG